jgi:hypothetical protein
MPLLSMDVITATGRGTTAEMHSPYRPPTDNESGSMQTVVLVDDVDEPSLTLPLLVLLSSSLLLLMVDYF